MILPQCHDRALISMVPGVMYEMFLPLACRRFLPRCSYMMFSAIGSQCSRMDCHPIILVRIVGVHDCAVNVPLLTHRHVMVAIIPPGLGVRYPPIASSSDDVDNPLRSKLRVSETYMVIVRQSTHQWHCICSRLPPTHIGSICRYDHIEYSILDHCFLTAICSPFRMAGIRQVRFH